MRADHLVITVDIEGGWMNDRIVIASPKGPPAPTVKSGIHAIIPHFPSNNVLNRVGRHEFDFTQMPERGSLMEVTCEDFRNGQHFNFDGVVGASTKEGALTIRVTLTASNLRGNVVEERKIEKVMVPTPISELINFEQAAFARDYPVKAEAHQRIKEDGRHGIEWDGYDEDN